MRGLQGEISQAQDRLTEIYLPYKHYCTPIPEPRTSMKSLGLLFLRLRSQRARAQPDSAVSALAVPPRAYVMFLSISLSSNHPYPSLLHPDIAFGIDTKTRRPYHSASNVIGMRNQFLLTRPLDSKPRQLGSYMWLRDG